MSFDTSRPMNILFLSRKDSARSIMAAALMNRLGRSRFAAYSAGIEPTGEIHPEVVKLLSGLGYDTGKMRSKSWTDFSAAGAPEMDFVISLYDAHSGEAIPTLPGRPLSARWIMANPAAAQGDDKTVALAFADTYRQLGNWVDLFVQLPFEKLDRQSLNARLAGIGGA